MEQGASIGSMVSTAAHADCTEAAKWHEDVSKIHELARHLAYGMSQITTVVSQMMGNTIPHNCLLQLVYAKILKGLTGSAG